MNKQNHAEKFREAVRLKMLIGQKIYIQESTESGIIKGVMIVEDTANVLYGMSDGIEELINFRISAVMTNPEGINFLIDHSEGAFVMECQVF